MTVTISCLWPRPLYSLSDINIIIRYDYVRILDQTQVESSRGEDISLAPLSCLYIQICRRDALLCVIA